MMLIDDDGFIATDTLPEVQTGIKGIGMLFLACFL